MRHVVLKGAFVSPLAATRPYARQITTTVWVRAAASPAASVNVRRIIVAASGNDNCQSIPNAARELIKSHFRTGTRNRDLRQRALCRTATSRGMALVSWSLTFDEIDGRCSATGRISRRRNPPIFRQSGGGLRRANLPYETSLIQRRPLDTRPHYSYLTKIPLAKDAFREGTP
jgi:hypothetical protein